jgi:hypothetical protein
MVRHVSNPKKSGPRSLRDFDYFDDARQPVAPGELPEDAELPSGLDAQLAAFHRERRARTRIVILALGVLAASAWFLWGYRYWIAYAFRTAREPLELGDVSTLRPAEIPHNAFVSLRGITEHRGLTQKTVRGLSVNRAELWYFRLVGSRGVFIEVPPDAERFGPVMEVAVRGRVVDPDREAGYSTLLATYDSRYFPVERPARRVVQVGVEPGYNTWVYVIAFLFFALLLGGNAWVVLRLVRLRRDAAARGLIDA